MINMPDSVDIESNEIKFIIATRLYEKGKLSLGEAAEIAGVSKRGFIELMGVYGVSVFSMEKELLKYD